MGCCGSGIRAAASRQYVAPSTLKGVIPVQPIPELPFIWQQQPTIPDYPTPKKFGAYYGNPPEKKKASR